MSTIRIAFSVDARPIEFELAYDETFAADRNTKAQASATGGVCEPEVVSLMARVLRPGDVAVDAGANIGFFSLLMSRLVGPYGRVLAFEPGSNNVDKIYANVRLNQMLNVDVIAHPLWDKAEQVILHMAHDSGRNSLAKTPESLGVLPIMATTLAVELADVSPRMVKIDIEGAEEAALAGSDLNPARCPYVVCEMNALSLEHFGATHASLRSTAQSMGYQTFLLHKDGALPSFLPVTTKLFPRMENLNVLFSTVQDVGTAWPEINV